MTELLYSLLFAGIAGISFLDVINLNRRSSILLSWLFLIILFLLSALRNNVGTDFSNYLQLFDVCPTFFEWLNGASFPSVQEFGYSLFVSLIKQLGGNAFTLFVLISLIQTIALGKLLHRFSLKPLVSLLFFFSLFYFTLYFNIIRQGVAIILIALAYQYFLRKEFKKACLLSVIAISFHTTALLIIPFFFISLIRLSKLGLLILLVMCILIAVLHDFYLKYLFVIAEALNQARYKNYVLVNASSHFDSSLYLLNCTFILLSSLWYDKFLNNKILLSKFYILFWGAIIQIALLPFGIVMSRFSLYFVFFQVLVFADILGLTTSFYQRLLLWGIYIMYTSLVFVVTIIMHNNGSVLNYSSWLF